MSSRHGPWVGETRSVLTGDGAEVRGRGGARRLDPDARRVVEPPARRGARTPPRARWWTPTSAASGSFRTWRTTTRPDWAARGGQAPRALPSPRHAAPPP